MVQKEKAALFSDGDAYEHYVGRWSRPVAHLFLDWLDPSPGLRWADVGCGTGALSGIILEKSDPGGVVGVEPSEGFRGVAQKSVEDARVEFRRGDAISLPLEDHEIDVVVSGLVLNFVPDKAQALKEMRRISKPGGTIAAYVWDYAGQMQLMRYFWNGVRELFPGGAYSDEEMQFSSCKPEPLADLFRSSDLREVETCALDVPTVFADFEDYWSPFLRGQGSAGAYCASLSEEERERLRMHLEDALPINSDGSISLIARAWAVRGRCVIV